MTGNENFFKMFLDEMREREKDRDRKQAERDDKLEKRLHSMEKTLTAIGVQDERINNIDAKVTALWRKFDALSEPEGTLTRLVRYQAQCPKDNLEKQMKWMWASILLTATMYAATLMIVLHAISEGGASG